MDAGAGNGTVETVPGGRSIGYRLQVSERSDAKKGVCSSVLRELHPAAVSGLNNKLRSFERSLYSTKPWRAKGWDEILK